MPISQLPDLTQKTTCTQNVAMDVTFHLRYVPVFNNVYILRYKWKNTKILFLRFFVNTLYLKLSWVAWFTLDILVKPINLHYLRCFPKVNQFEKWLNGYLRYLRPFSHTYIRNLSLVKWLSTLSTSVFAHIYSKIEFG